MSAATGKTILVTGASSGLGQSMALALAQAGHRVFGTSRRAQADLLESGALVRMLPLDVTDEDSVRACIEGLRQEAAGVDVLISNAGSGLTGAIEDCTGDEVQWQMETNFFGPLRMLRAVLPLMRQQGGGRIITVGSMAGHVGMPYQGIYSASKHALEAVNEALRLELRGHPVDATILCPGDFRTGFGDARVFARGALSAAHGEQMDITIGICQRDECNGASPQLVSDLVCRLVTAPRLKPRYFVGRLDQRLGVGLKQILPATGFEWLMRKIYQLR